MEKGKLIFETNQDRGYSAKAWELVDDKDRDSLIEIIKEEKVIRSFKFPAYKVYNISAHFSDIVDSEIAENTIGYAVAASDGMGGSAHITPVETQGKKANDIVSAIESVGSYLNSWNIGPELIAEWNMIKETVVMASASISSANEKWTSYEQDYILPAFDFSDKIGFDLKRAISNSSGKNCVALLVEHLASKAGILGLEYERRSKEEMKETLKKTISSLVDSFNKELFEKTQEQLEEHWFFKRDDKKTKERNLYEFYDMLKLYEHHCERWEEHRSGSICIVERVRDKYLMPKIKEFLAQEVSDAK